MTNPPSRAEVRRAGLLYLVPAILGPFSMMYVPSRIVVPGDAGATASRLLASTTLFRLGMLSDLLIVLSELALTALLYAMLAPAGRSLAAVATLARLAMTVLQAANLWPQLAALLLLGEAGYLASFEPAQRQGLALWLLELHGQFVHVWEVTFGMHCALVGLLVFRSGYFPRWLGRLMGVASVGYLLNGLGCLVLPVWAPIYAIFVGITALVGEVPFVFYLVFRGGRERPAGEPMFAG